jgi:cellulose synthase/poly-beta-1,6-N-acetylglucosamine synthase-like glycosyltransferase
MISKSSRTTVIVPAFNRADFLAETLESALSQTLPPLEILVVDDASTDDTVRVAQRFPVTLIRHDQNRGISEARNTAIAQARGEFVAFLDSDDLYLPDHLECTTDLLDTYPTAGLAFTPIVWFGERSGKREPVIEPFIPRDCYWDLIDGCFVPIQSTVVRRSVFGDVGVFEPGLRTEDYEWFLRLARRTPFVASDRVTAKYRLHQGQISKSVRRMIFGNWEVLLRERTRLAAGTEAAADVTRFDAITRHLVQRQLESLVYSGDYQSIQSLASLLTEHGAMVQAAEIGASHIAKSFGRSLYHRLPDAAKQRIRALRHAMARPTDSGLLR